MSAISILGQGLSFSIPVSSRSSVGESEGIERSSAFSAAPITDPISPTAAIGSQGSNLADSLQSVMLALQEGGGEGAFAAAMMSVEEESQQASSSDDATANSQSSSSGPPGIEQFEAEDPRDAELKPALNTGLSDEEAKKTQQENAEIQRQQISAEIDNISADIKSGVSGTDSRIAAQIMSGAANSARPVAMAQAA
ncbi:hypothetical protein [Thalassospira alkalitolerans]|uniref:Uncharacterized protein n=1 Tax=Thalassospira alkalitolerans TaxID=1293890 RepID=A0A1Y2LEU7_9PROT|nr:hypothetical protein [Thalassospira alkalitolerans]OSQ49490.1 hypothetical protein TALK_03810 [Thalassospira alkalitolerans]